MKYDILIVNNHFSSTLILRIPVQVPHLHQDGAAGHAGDHQCPGSPQVSQVVQVHNSGTENRAVDDNSWGS